MQKFPKVFTLMSAILALFFCAVACKTDDDDEPTMYTVTVSSSIEHGKVTADKTSAEAGATVKLTATADEDYELDSYSVKDTSANELTVMDGTFTMPKSNVTVSATFKETAVTPQKTAGSISYATTTVEKTTAAEAFTNTLTNTGDGTVSYASSKETVATVNATTGEVTIAGAGKTTITATVADSDTYTYETKTASYTLTVTQASPLNLNLKTGGAINSILVQLCAGSACTKFARSDTNNEEATLYLDTEEKYIPVWSVGTEVYYYVPDGCTPVMNEDSSGMFVSCSELTSLDVTGFDTSKVTNMSSMFSGCEGLTSLDVDGFDTSNVTNMSFMFADCSGLTSLDVTGFDTSKVTNMLFMFADCSGLTSLDVTGFDTSKVTNMSFMFTRCSDLTSLDVSKFNTSNVTDMRSMFSGCEGLTSLDLSSFDTSNVTNMEDMFSGCEGLTSLDLSKFDTGNVTDMLYMFSDCKGLTSLDLSKFDTGNVTDMRSMFSGCKGLTSLDLSSFDTSNVTDMEGMFSFCEGLTSLDLSSFDTSNVTDMKSMFAGCEGLTSLDLSKFDTGNVTDMSYMFSFCEGLTTIYATDKFVTTSVTSGGYCFYNCSKLRGGAGTTYDSSRMSADYARIDGGTDAPGYFTLKPIGSKSKPDAVGDIVFTDGSATPYSADLTLTDAQKAAAIALIFYKGTGLNSGDDTTTSRTLGVGLKHYTKNGLDGLAWCLDSAAAYSKNITTIQCPASGDAGALTFTGDRNGSDNLEQIEAFDGVDDTATAANYPAFYFAKNYSDTATNIAGTDYESGWYLPSIAELFQIYANGKGENKVFDIDAASEALGGDKFGTSCYWSSSQYASYDDMSYQLSFYNEGLDGYYYKDYDLASCVCAVRAFN